jgi:hypothetical protein
MTGAQTVHTAIDRTLKPVTMIVRAVDDMAPDTRPFGRVRLSLAPRRGSTMPPKSAVSTPGGNFAFFDVAGGDYLLLLSAEYYVERQFGISIPFDPNAKRDEDLTIQANGRAIVATVTLLPSPSYVSGPGMTVIRVLVRKSGSERPVSGACIRALRPAPHGKAPINALVGRTDRNGQALLCCNRITHNGSVLRINGFNVGGSEPLTLKAVDAVSERECEAELHVKEFATKSMYLEIKSKGTEPRKAGDPKTKSGKKGNHTK